MGRNLRKQQYARDILWIRRPYVYILRSAAAEPPFGPLSSAGMTTAARVRPTTLR